MTEIKKVTFDVFHPLDHFIGSARCRAFYGGWKNHLALTWDYKWKPALHRIFLCPLGFHKITPYWRGQFFGEGVEPTGYNCHYCWLKYGSDE